MPVTACCLEILLRQTEKVCLEHPRIDIFLLLLWLKDRTCVDWDSRVFYNVRVISITVQENSLIVSVSPQLQAAK